MMTSSSSFTLPFTCWHLLTAISPEQACTPVCATVNPFGNYLPPKPGLLCPIGLLLVTSRVISPHPVCCQMLALFCLNRHAGLEIVGFGARGEVVDVEFLFCIMVHFFISFHFVIFCSCFLLLFF